jgi:hypothetical protein
MFRGPAAEKNVMRYHNNQQLRKQNVAYYNNCDNQMMTELRCSIL